MEKLDLKKSLKYLYEPSAKAFSVVDVPSMNFIMIDGHGNPNTSVEYAESVQALYTAAYTLKFKIKKEMAVGYPVMASEGLGWMDDMREFSVTRKDDWKWTMMIMQPEIVTPGLFSQAVEEAMQKKGQPALSRLRLESFHEGLAAQILYFGAYAEEGPTIARLHQYIEESGHVRFGKHHEIYLGDPRRTAPETLRPAIRQPMRKP
ncbi:MAG TPA: GyrI-like domain-containing protein [Anaerolineales bacterium]